LFVRLYSFLCFQYIRKEDKKSNQRDLGGGDYFLKGGAIPLKKLFPHFHYKAIYQIDLSELHDRGIRGIIVDLDNTLVPHNHPHVSPQLAEWILKVRKFGF
jgi:hypothetical protein